jgi:hypothetical protein
MKYVAIYSSFSVPQISGLRPAVNKRKKLDFNYEEKTCRAIEAKLTGATIN